MGGYDTRLQHSLDTCRSKWYVAPTCYALVRHLSFKLICYTHWWCSPSTLVNPNAMTVQSLRTKSRNGEPPNADTKPNVNNPSIYYQNMLIPNHHEFIICVHETWPKCARELSPHYAMFSNALKTQIHESNKFDMAEPNHATVDPLCKP